MDTITDTCTIIARIQTELGRKFVTQDVDDDLLDMATVYARGYTGDFDYMRDMRAAVERWGGLTDGQAKGVLNCMAASGRRTMRERATADVVRRVDRLVPGGTYDVAGVTLRVRLSDDGGASVSVPDPDSTWGWSRVCLIGPSHDVTPAWAATPDRLRAVRDLMAEGSDVMAAAVTYGRRTGRCGVCGRELTDPDSIAAGIGPVCASRLG